MKIDFLGTSHGVPSKERYCQSVLFTARDNGYLIDAGAPVMDLLIRRSYDLKKLKAVFITHMHTDHTDGLFRLLSLADWYYKKMSYDLYLPEQKGIDCIMEVMKYHDPAFAADRLRFHRMQEGLVFENDDIRVSAFPTGHIRCFNRPAYGYLLEAEGKRVYLSGDLDAERVDYPEFLDEEETDVLIVECAHFPAARLLERLKTCKAKRVMVIHAGPEDELEKIRKAAGDFPFPLLLPNDGDCFDV